MFILLFCAQGLCQTPAQTSSLANSFQPLAGRFESAARGEFVGMTNSEPLFTLTLGTNGTYFVFCASPDVEPNIDGDRKLFSRPGNEFGTWKWDREHSEVVFTATNRSHMTRAFPTHMKVDQRNLNRLTAINTAPPKDLTIPYPWVPLSSPYFYRKVSRDSGTSDAPPLVR